MFRTMLALTIMLTACSIEGGVYVTTGDGDGGDDQPQESSEGGSGGLGATSVDHGASSGSDGGVADSTTESTSGSTTGDPCSEPADPVECMTAYDATGVLQCYCDGVVMCTMDPCEDGTTGTSDTGCEPEIRALPELPFEAFACVTCDDALLPPADCGCPEPVDDCVCAGSSCGPCVATGALCLCGVFLAPAEACLGG